MKRALIFVAGLALIAGLALAAGPTNQDVGWAFKGGLSIGSGSTYDTAANRISKRLGGSSTVDFAAGYNGVIFSSAITKAGAAVGDICTVSAPAAASALKAKFSCVVTATDEVKVIFEPISHQRGQATLVTGTPSTVVVASITASSLCTATPVGTTAAIAAGGLATSLTTTNLTITGPDSVTTVVNYDCAAPVDPASGTYTFELTRNGS